MGRPRKYFIKNGKQECGKCGKWLSVEDFYQDKKRPTGLSIYCKACDLSLSRNRARTIREKYWNKWKTILQDSNFFICRICNLDCSEKGWFPALQFHHINPKSKKYNMNQIFLLEPTQEYIKELKKCIPMCGNCHKRWEWWERHMNYRNKQESFITFAEITKRHIISQVSQLTAKG